MLLLKYFDIIFFSLKFLPDQSIRLKSWSWLKVTGGCLTGNCFDGNGSATELRERGKEKISFAQRKIKVNKRCWANSVYIVSPKFTPIIRPGAKVWWQYRNSFTCNRQLVRHGSVCMFFVVVIFNHHFVLFNSQSPLICLKDRLAFSQVYIKLTEFIGLILKT